MLALRLLSMSITGKPMPKCSFCGETLRYLGTGGGYTCDNPNCPDPINQQAQQIIASRKLEEKLPE
jgi:tRNA(Ile2) C34 agmatinyltransferase TiaS